MTEMFSLLAQGKATWDGGIEWGERPPETDKLLPFWFMRLPTSPYKSCSKFRDEGETGALLYEDGKMTLPKTFVTRKGALLLFTPTVILQEHQPHQVGETLQCFPDVFADDTKLGTVVNFANTVLQFGKEGPGKKDSLPMEDKKSNQQKTSKDKHAALLKFLHYLDSDNRQDNRLIRPGCDQGFYLDNLKEKTRCESSKVHIDTNVDLSEDGLSEMISDYLRRSVSNTELKSIPLKTCQEKHVLECSKAIENFYDPVSRSVLPDNDLLNDTFSSRVWLPKHLAKRVSSRPYTAPIPPQPKFLRTNPRIISAKPSTTRALGSTTYNLQEVLHADLGCSSRRDTKALAFSKTLRDGSLQGSIFYGNTPRATPESIITPFEEHPRSLDVIEGEYALSSKYVMHQECGPFRFDLSKGSGSTKQLVQKYVPSEGVSKETSKRSWMFATKSEIQTTGCSTRSTSHVAQEPSTGKVFDSEGNLSCLHASEASNRHKVTKSGFDYRSTSLRSNSKQTFSLSHSIQSETSRAGNSGDLVIDRETLPNNSSPWFTDDHKNNQQDRESATKDLAKSRDIIGTVESDDDLNELTENMDRNKFSDYRLLDDVLRNEDYRSDVQDPHDEIEIEHYENRTRSFANAQERITGEPDIPYLCASADDITLIEKNTEQTHFDISSSRPTSAVDHYDSNQHVSVTEAVKQFIQKDHRTETRRLQSNARSHGWFEDKPMESVIDHKIAKLKNESESENRLKGSKTLKSSRSQEEMYQSATSKNIEIREGGRKEEANSLVIPVVMDNLRCTGDYSREETAKRPAPSHEEKEAKENFSNGSLSEPKSKKIQNSLRLKGNGQNVREITDKQVDVLVKSSLQEEKAMISLLKTPASRKVKFRKSSKKRSKAIVVDPENIDFERFSSPELLEHMDEELKHFVQQRGSLETLVGKEAACTVANENQKERPVSIQFFEVGTQEKIEKKGAYSPSKIKKLTKKGKKKMKKMDKIAREDEFSLLKVKEAEAESLNKEAELKQQIMEEERLQRLAEEEEAKRQEQDALEQLKIAKRKAREERENKRALEAERRRQEVQRKREEKQRLEQELRKREIEEENRKLNHERRMAEIEEQRRLQAELERRLEEQQREEEHLLRLQEEEEARRLEEERVREAEEKLLRLREERELKEQMRRIAEAQAEKLRKAEEERLRQEKEEQLRAEEERRRLEKEELERTLVEQQRKEMAKRLEAAARMHAQRQAAIRKSLLLRRRERNIERQQNLKFTRQNQSVTRANVFTYFIELPQNKWKLVNGEYEITAEENEKSQEKLIKSTNV